MGPARCPPSRSFPPSPPAGSRGSGAGSRPQPARLGSARLALKARGRRSPGCWKPRRGFFLQPGSALGRLQETAETAAPAPAALQGPVAGRCCCWCGAAAFPGEAQWRHSPWAQIPSERESSSPLIPSHPRVCGTVLPCAAGTAAYLSLPTKHFVYTGCRQGRVKLSFPSPSLLLASLSWNKRLPHGQLPSAVVLGSRKTGLMKLNSFAQWAKEERRMVPEKARHFEHDDTVALALLVRGFKLPDMYIHRCACTYRYICY